MNNGFFIIVEKVKKYYRSALGTVEDINVTLVNKP